TLLAACPPGARRDVYRIVAEPGHPRESAAHMAGVIEHVVLSAGRALVGVAGEPVELGPGDYICYPADLPHVFQALTPGTLAVLVSEHT
ncbi:MAG TPA: cupin domain-containing protein, partial [Streptosporangiaceae bacterium]|nr:cupin domain-containing protein [Streptosporangiaceae bacterium]